MREMDFNKYVDGKVKLLKANTGNFLFIQLDLIGRFSYLRFKEILNVDDINKLFTDLDVQHQFKENGLIIPMDYSNKIFINIYDNYLHYLHQYKDIYQLFKEKQIELSIQNLGSLIEINKLFPDYFSRINFSYNNRCDSSFTGEYSISEINGDQD